MKISNYILITVLLISFKISKAQQQSLQSQYIMNPFIVNPGVSGTNKYGNISTSYREQWIGFTGRPRTIYLTGHMPIDRSMDEYHHHSHNSNWKSAGAKIFLDNIGPIKTIGVYGNGAYNISLSEGKGDINDKEYTPGLKLSLGLDLGILNYKFDTDYFSEYTQGIIEDDVTYLNISNNQSTLHPDGNLGLYLFRENEYFVGLSISQIFGNRILSNDDKYTFNTDDNYHLSQHFYLLGGYHYAYNEKFTIHPSILLRTVAGGNTAIDFNLKVDYIERYWAGLSYRFGRAAGIMIGGLFEDKYEISYSFDFITSSFSSTNSGSHEITISYRLPVNYVISNPADNLE